VKERALPPAKEVAMERPTRRARRPPRATLVRRWSVVAVVLIVGYFYYHPIRAYFSTRDELGSTRTEVRRLQQEKDELTQRLSASSSPQALARAARELGYVRPGEHLFIVKGIETWMQRHTHSAGSK
jgi:cell division protein FtsB